MPNTNLTHLMVARMSAKIFTEEAPFTMSINKGRQEEFGQAVNGFNKGDTVKIKIPSVGQVFTGAVFAGGGAATDNVEQFVNLTLSDQKHVALQFGAKEMLLELPEEIEDWKERILRPQIRVLSSSVEADLLSKAYQAVPNLVGTPGTIPATMKTYAQARAKLEAFLAPPSDRSVCFSSDAQVELGDASKALFHANAAIERLFIRGTLGEAQGADFYESQNMPSHINGTQNMSVMLVNGVPAEGATTLAIDTGTGSNTIKKGTSFTIANVLSVHPLTGTAYVPLQQFTVTADLTLSAGAGTISVFPAFKAVAPNKVINALPADNAAITMAGAASASMRQNLMFQKDAFTAAFAPLKKLAGTEGYTARLPNGFSIRVMTFGEGRNDIEGTRVDVLYGFTAVRGQHACRITE